MAQLMTTPARTPGGLPDRECLANAERSAIATGRAGTR
ncbi:hypothetical protein SAMN05421630_110125 [Prauserella marina]|uniref:Uncharacterized protein n=1 Tax=Prauserella marina TaxID=530584 RepID=A0A1G6W1E9_9PSEU|nr:hypothetical protein DES30_108125 [Prauserella marina]SDD59661.1 hypothetical protein SAMN05421630_110125 [Prauserella marina]